MKFPSLKHLAENATATIRRYPFEVIFALAGTISATTNIELMNLNRIAEGWCIRITMIGNLGLLLSLAASLYTKSNDFDKPKSLYIKFAAALLAVLLVFIINPAERQSDYMRFFLLSLSFHLLVAYAAFTSKGQIQGFWQFNKTLFLRFLTSVLYGAVLYIGLAAAIGAMNFLFNFKFEWDTFAILWVWIVGVFSTLFFLAGIPVDIKQLDNDTSYPKGLKIFTQYVLIPLATIYVVILLAYEVKILIQWNLPRGLVSNLILGYAVFGILSLLLVYPVREQEENKWLKTYARSFYFLLLPLLLLLFIAVATRVFRYGITEERYFLILLAFWLLFISVYFLFYKKQNIKLIPISLSILTLLSVYGPQSAFSVSMYSQRGILVDFFKKHNAYKEGKFESVDSSKISLKDGSHAVGSVSYLIGHHGFSSLQPYFKKDLKKIDDSLMKQKSRLANRPESNGFELKGREVDWVKKQLGLNEFSEYYYGSDDSKVLIMDEKMSSYRFSAENHVIDIKGYDYMINANDRDTAIEKVNGINFMHKMMADKEFVLEINNEMATFETDSLAQKLLKTKDIDKYVKSGNQTGYNREYVVPSSMLVLTKQTRNFTITFIIDNISFNKNGKRGTKPLYTAGSYFIRKR